MKPYLFLLVIVLFMGMVYKIHERLGVKKETAQKIQTLPDLASVKWTKPDTMIHNKPTIIILFDPTCELCHREADQLRQRQADLAHVAVYWLTTESQTQARSFAHAHRLDTLHMMHVGTVSHEEAYQAFGPTVIPHIFVYGADKQLRREYKGETGVETLLKYL
jgi:hypothetical protein